MDDDLLFSTKNQFQNVVVLLLTFLPPIIGLNIGSGFLIYLILGPLISLGAIALTYVLKVDKSIKGIVIVFNIIVAVALSWILFSSGFHI
jgi:hypothetical protein